MPGDGDTATRVLDTAEHLVQHRGFNGFSYADVAGELGVSKAALHYHFASKAELGEALLVRYTARFMAALHELDGLDLDAASKLERYVDLYADVLRNDRMCLCGMLAAEYLTLPAPMQTAVTTFFEVNERWLAELLHRGQTEGTLLFSEPSTEKAHMIVSTLEGAMLVARPTGDVSGFETTGSHLVHELLAPANAPRSAGADGHTAASP